MSLARQLLLAAPPVLALAGLLGSVGTGSADGPPACSPPSAATDTRTDLVAHPDAPIVAGRNVVWCAASQLAWDALADVIGKDGRLALLPPAPADLVESLNRRSFPHAAIDAKACLALGGLARDGVVERIRAAWVATFGAEARPPELALRPSDAAGVAGLAKDLPFERPFSVHPAPVAFAGGTPSLRAWGIRSYETGPGAEAAAEQVRAYVPPDYKFHQRLSAVVVELRPKDADERIFLARLEPKATLDATWAAVDEILRTWTADAVSPGSLLVVPRIRLDADARFSALEGAAIAGIPDAMLRSFRERVRFSLTERGASVRAESAVVASLGIHPDLVFDQPFLVALRRADQKRPYLLLWIGNDLLLERFVAPRIEPPDAATVKALAGKWVIDPDLSYDATLLRQFELGMTTLLELGFAPDAKPTPGEILDRMKAAYPRSKDDGHYEVRLGVGPGAHAVLEVRYRGKWVPDGAFERVEGDVVRIDGRMSVRLPASPGEPMATDEVPVTLDLRDGRVEIRQQDQVWVLRRP